MKIFKRILFLLVSLFVFVIGAAFVIPIIFKDKLVEFAKREINNSLNAIVNFDDVDLSLFRSFPDLNFAVKNILVEGIEEFEGIKLAAIESFDITLDLMSVIKSSKPIQIESIHVGNPELNVIVLKDRRANYDIAKTAGEAEAHPADVETSNFEIKLKEYSISGANIIYDDRSTDLYVQLEELDHAGSGKLKRDIYDLITKTAIGAFTARQGGITYLDKAKTSLDALLNIDQKTNTYTLKDNELLINALKLNAEGYVQLDGDDINMELSLNTPQNEFKNLLSLVPNAFIEGYEDVKANGKFALDAQVQGKYNSAQGLYPAFRINLEIKDGDFKYPDLPLGIDNINTEVNIDSPTSDFDDMTVDVKRFSLRAGNNPLDGRFKLKTPVSDPDIDARVNGVIDLAAFSKAYPMQDIEDMGGIITADITVKTKMSYIDKQDYEKVDMQGELKLEDVQYKSAGLPPVNIRQMEVDFTPKNARRPDGQVNINSFEAKLGRSDIRASATIENILAYFSPQKTMKGTFKLRSNFFDANEWVPEEADDSSPSVIAVDDNASSGEDKIFDRFDFNLDVKANEIVYEEYRLTDAVARGNMAPNRLRLKALAAKIGKSDFKASGVITNIFDYLFKEGTLGGNLKVYSQFMDLNQFMIAEDASASSSEESYEAILIPDNINMEIEAAMDEVLYTNLTLRDLSGKLLIANEAVVLEDTKAKTLGGRIVFSGAYDTEDHENPAFSMKYDIKGMNFQKAFFYLNTFQQLAPIGKFIDGTFSSSMILDGKLKKNLMPVLSSLNAKGFLHTLDGIIKGFKPLKIMGNSLNINYLKDNVRIKDVKSWFEVKNGAVELKDFDYNYKDIDMVIGGKHGINQEMDYHIKAKVPRELLEKNAIGAAAGSGFDLLQKEASKLGLNLKKGEFVNVLINLTGSLTDPKVKLKLLGMDGETSLVKAAEDKITEELEQKKEELIEQGQQIVEKTKETVSDTVKAVANKAVEQATKEAEDLLKKEGTKLGSALDTTLQNQLDTILGDKSKEEIDKIKEELGKWNPFKKKKKKKDNQ